MMIAQPVRLGEIRLLVVVGISISAASNLVKQRLSITVGIVTIINSVVSGS